MDFTIEDVGTIRFLWLDGARDKWAQENIYEPSEFVWDEDYWFEMDHIFIEQRPDGKYMVFEYTGFKDYLRSDMEGINAEQVVDLVHKLSKGLTIEHLVE